MFLLSSDLSILVTLNEHYLPQLEVMLTSLHASNPGENVSVWLIHRSLTSEQLARLERRCGLLGFSLHPVTADAHLFADAPLTRQYPQEMYYRLLAAQLLPEEMHRVIYLDPDILVINPLRPLWELDLAGNLFAAAAHTGKTELANSVNQVRLGTDHDYFNSGVLLMDLDAGRRWINPETLFDFTRQHARELLFPDQDLLNMLYGSLVLPLDDAVWNYDARNFNNYYLRSGGDCDMDWVFAHTAVLHFCGKAKPWKPGYRRRFGPLYQHYMRLTQLAMPD
nr:glycosyltransferase family 8 protein [Fournierella massiliensis]